MVRVCASHSVDPGSMICRVVPKTLKKRLLTASLLDCEHQRYSIEKNPASVFFVLLSKALSGIHPALCDRQVLFSSSLPVAVV